MHTHIYSTNKITFAGDVAQLVEGLPSPPEALGLILTINVVLWYSPQSQHRGDGDRKDPKFKVILDYKASLVNRRPCLKIINKMPIPVPGGNYFSLYPKVLGKKHLTTLKESTAQTNPTLA